VHTQHALIKGLHGGIPSQKVLQIWNSAGADLGFQKGGTSRDSIDVINRFYILLYLLSRHLYRYWHTADNMIHIYT